MGKPPKSKVPDIFSSISKTDGKQQYCKQKEMELKNECSNRQYK